MFYSQTFLARKGPLGTVWCAAHLQHRLKKSHYTATDIPSTVDRIMCPEVPIALRMSGHLLLGVVRIYSKKVDYLFHDCNIVLVGLKKVFAPIQVNLPEDARQAPTQAITLPDTFDLDAMELDDETCNEGASDNHLSNQEDITLRDQIPIGTDPYVAITFDEDITMDASPPDVFHKSGSLTVNEHLHEPQENDGAGFQDPGQHNQVEMPSPSAAFHDPGLSITFPERLPKHPVYIENPGPSNQAQVDSISNESSQDVPGIERMRDASDDFYAENGPPECSDHRNDPTVVSDHLDQVLNEKEIHTPNSNMLASGVPSMPFHQRSDPATSPSKGPPDTPFVRESPQLVIQPSPPVQQPRQRRITRRRFFDEKLVLPNRLMKRALEDCSDLVRKRIKIPCSALDVWKLNNTQRIEQVLNDPSLTGLCADICDMFKRECISTKPHMMVPEEVVQEPTVLRCTVPTTKAISEHRLGQDPASIPALENLRHSHYATDDDFTKLGSYPAGSMSPFRRDESRFSTNSSESELAANAGSISTPDTAAFIGTHGSDINKPMTLLEEQSCLKDTGFSAPPEADLFFLEEDVNTPTESLASQGVDSISGRTRALANYLKSQSPTTSFDEYPHGDLSLNKILEGKTRKICARMFFETLVLKSRELVDVRQEQPYGDITLKLTPTLWKAEI
ncbi:hypothetical protein CCACVL1_19259 [Corchorus capsularis]|uniref:Rad21/Rec8-like protein n=1 Tax=Corchorus capsularis TaxID=210143 RepID=A0A1R3HHD3_COCAP|nr:hypothetical protein CCACVL1_19259 [Corchorus capsularis]